MNNIPPKEDVRYLAPEITEERVWNYKNLGLVIVLGVFIIAVAILMFAFLNITTTYKLLIAWGLTMIYAIVLFFALEPRILRQIKETAVRTIFRPIEKRVVIEKPVPAQPVEKKIVEKPVYIEKPKKPTYDYIGSSQTKTYHKSKCKFSKLIKPEFKRESDNASYFQMRDYKRCRSCFGLKKRSRKKKTSKSKKTSKRKKKR
jgi:hypothetical protein